MPGHYTYHVSKPPGYLTIVCKVLPRSFWDKLTRKVRINCGIAQSREAFPLGAETNAYLAAGCCNTTPSKTVKLPLHLVNAVVVYDTVLTEVLGLKEGSLKPLTW